LQCRPWYWVRSNSRGTPFDYFLVADHVPSPSPPKSATPFILPDIVALEHHFVIRQLAAVPLDHRAKPFAVLANLRVVGTLTNG